MQKSQILKAKFGLNNLTTPPPSSLMAIGIRNLALFFGKYCNNQVKIPTGFNVICPYFDKLSKLK